MNIIKDSTNNKWSRKGQKPDIIVCHITDGSYGSAVSWFKNPESGVSAHFVIGRNGEITQLIDIKDASWAQGLSTSAIRNASLGIVRTRGINPNLYCISIEHEGFYDQTRGELTEAQKKASIELIKHIIAEVKRIYGIDIPADRKHIIGHCEINPKGKPHCPGELFPFDEIIAGVKGTTSDGKDTPTLKNGCRVKINTGALKYSTGQAIPLWVKKGTYTVLQINSNEKKVLLKEIMSWVNICDITLI